MRDRRRCILTDVAEVNQRVSKDTSRYYRTLDGLLRKGIFTSVQGVAQPRSLRWNTGR